MWCLRCGAAAYNHDARPAEEGEDAVVGLSAAGGGVDCNIDVFVELRLGGEREQHALDVVCTERLVQRVEREARELGLDEVGPVLHDGLEAEVALAGLPARDEVQHVGALVGLAVVDALGASELDAHADEHRAPGRLVAHLDEARVEVDGRGQGRDREERRAADDHERRDGLVEEAGVDVRRLLEDEDVAARALGGPDLRGRRRLVLSFVACM